MRRLPGPGVVGPGAHPHPHNRGEKPYGPPPPIGLGEEYGEHELESGGPLTSFFKGVEEIAEPGQDFVRQSLSFRRCTQLRWRESRRSVLVMLPKVLTTLLPDVGPAICLRLHIGLVAERRVARC